MDPNSGHISKGSGCKGSQKKETGRSGQSGRARGQERAQDEHSAGILSRGEARCKEPETVQVPLEEKAEAQVPRLRWCVKDGVCDKDVCGCVCVCLCVCVCVCV